MLTSALALDSVLYTAYAVSEARLRRPQALVGCAEVFEFLRQSGLQRRELLDREGREVDLFSRHFRANSSGLVSLVRLAWESRMKVAVSLQEDLNWEDELLLSTV